MENKEELQTYTINLGRVDNKGITDFTNYGENFFWKFDNKDKPENKWNKLKNNHVFFSHPRGFVFNP